MLPIVNKPTSIAVDGRTHVHVLFGSVVIFQCQEAGRVLRDPSNDFIDKSLLGCFGYMIPFILELTSTNRKRKNKSNLRYMVRYCTYSRIEATGTLRKIEKMCMRAQEERGKKQRRVLLPVAMRKKLRWSVRHMRRSLWMCQAKTALGSC
jgi:hypothetical protein